MDRQGNHQNLLSAKLIITNNGGPFLNYCIIYLYFFIFQFWISIYFGIKIQFSWFLFSVESLTYQCTIYDDLFHQNQATFWNFINGQLMNSKQSNSEKNGP